MDKVLVFKLVKTTCLIIAWACMGLYNEITGVTIQDLRERTQSNYEILGQAMSMRMAGYGAGAIFGGFLMDRFRNSGDLVISISLTIAALVCAVIAYTPYVQIMFVEFAIQGVMGTLIATAGQMSLVDLWKDKVSGPMHILHLGYGAGSFLVPQIAKPFLSERIPKTSSKFYLQNCLGQDNISYASTSQHLNESNPSLNNISTDEHDFENAYLIVMAVVLTNAAMFGGFFYTSHKRIIGNATQQRIQESKKSLKEIFNFNSCSPGHPKYAAMIFCFLFFWFYISTGGQMIFANYIYSYSRDLLCLDKDRAANILSTFWLGYTAGRFAGFFVAIWAPMNIVIFVEAAGNLISALVLYFNPADATIVWIFSGVSGFFVGPLYPSGMAWANRYLTMTGLAYTITMIGGSLAGVTFIVVIGWLFQNEGPSTFWYFVVGYSAVACIVAICMHLVARTIGDKYEREDNSKRGEESQHVEYEDKQAEETL